MIKHYEICNTLENDTYFKVPKVVYIKYKDMVSLGEDTTFYVQVMYDLYHVIEVELNDPKVRYNLSREEFTKIDKLIKRLYVIDDINDINVLPFHIKSIKNKIKEVKDSNIF
jgi:hypothetical protein